jgi:hypothetical protein
MSVLRLNPHGLLGRSIIGVRFGYVGLVMGKIPAIALNGNINQCGNASNP